MGVAGSQGERPAVLKPGVFTPSRSGWETGVEDLKSPGRIYLPFSVVRSEEGTGS